MSFDLEDKIVSVVNEVTHSVVSIIKKDVDPKKSGTGSGVILSEDGYIVTNAHVVKGMEEVDVILPDGMYVKAKVVGESNVKDIAILKTDAIGLHPIELGDPTGVRLGQFCLAVGNALGMGTTVTFGMVSGLGRAFAHQELQLNGLIQTSAPINPGNSGGALLNLDGQLIGIPTLTIMFTDGVGFAISVADVLFIYNRFLETGDATSPLLGIKTQSLTKDFAEEKGLGVHIGALVVDTGDGIGHIAGLLKMDVIVGADDTVVNDADDLKDHIIRLRSGHELRLRLYREGVERLVTVTL